MEKETTICFIGAGNVATHLGKVLKDTPYTLKGIYSHTFAHAKELANKLRGSIIATDNLSALPDAGIYVFMVKDTILDQTALQLRDTLDETTAHTSLFIHTAGSMPLQSLSGVFTHAAVMYPLQSFSKEATLDFKEIPLFLETTDVQAQAETERLAHTLSDHVSQLDSEGRKVLHLAGVFANNFTNHCIALAHDLLCQSGIAPNCLGPILQETFRKSQQMNPHEAQTGPARRNDTNVMVRHLQMLEGQPDLQEVYHAMSQSILKYYSPTP